MRTPITGVTHNPWAYDDAMTAGGLAEWEKAEAAQETLMAIDEMAGMMMNGQRFFSPRHNGLGPLEHSLRQCGYTDDPEFEVIEAALAKGGDLIETALKLRELMKKWCRFDAASYLNEDIDILEDLVREHLPKEHDSAA